MRRWTVLAIFVACLAACGDPDCPEGTRYDGVRCVRVDEDAGTGDAGGADAGHDASGSADAGSSDAGTVTAECETDAECDDRDACNGTETCDPRSNTCVRGTEPDCDDDNPCTADSCDAEVGCINELVDADGDGFAAGTCPAGTPDGDCDDDDETVYPGAPELCDDIDNDCNDAVDDDVEVVTCYPDGDGDGFPSESDPMEACVCPDGHVPARPDGRWDCFDSDFLVAMAENANPDQTMFSADAYCPSLTCSFGRSWDWDCDGTETKRWGVAPFSYCREAIIGTGCIGSGYTGESAPDCGDSAEYRLCERPCPTCSCTARTETRTQECR